MSEIQNGDRYLRIDGILVEIIGDGDSYDMRDGEDTFYPVNLICHGETVLTTVYAESELAYLEPYAVGAPEPLTDGVYVDAAPGARPMLWRRLNGEWSVLVRGDGNAADPHWEPQDGIDDEQARAFGCNLRLEDVA